MSEQILGFDVGFIHHDNGKLEANAIRVVSNRLMGQIVISDDRGDEEHVRHLLNFFCMNTGDDTGLTRDLYA